MLSELNQRVTLEQETLVPDGAGGYLATWNVIASIWASIEPLTGSDVFGPDATESRVRYHVTIRRRGDVIAGMRIRKGSRAFLIRAVLDEGAQSQFLNLLTEETG